MAAGLALRLQSAARSADFCSPPSRFLFRRPPGWLAPRTAIFGLFPAGWSGCAPNGRRAARSRRSHPCSAPPARRSAARWPGLACSAGSGPGDGRKSRRRRGWPLQRGNAGGLVHLPPRRKNLPLTLPGPLAALLAARLGWLWPTLARIPAAGRSRGIFSAARPGILTAPTTPGYRGAGLAKNHRRFRNAETTNHQWRQKASAAAHAGRCAGG